MEGQAMVGHRVCVYWPLEKRFFKGKVASYTPGQVCTTKQIHG
jgi:hypothetical protein